MSDTASTYVCRLTAEGRGAIAVVGVSGPAATELVALHFQSANGLTLPEQPLERIVYGQWSGEDLVVCRLAEDHLEVHCHGGHQSPQRIVAALVSSGAVELNQEQWAKLEASSVIGVESLLALAGATTRRTAQHFLSQLRGSLEEELQAIRTLVEANEVAQAKQRVKGLLRWHQLGRHLSEPWQVVVAGAPNVGKSSLVNAIVGFDRAIVYDQPGTTRDVVSTLTAINGWPVQLSDTAGICATDDQVEAEGIGLAIETVARSDLVVWVLDATRLEADSSDVQSVVAADIERAGMSVPADKLLVVINKIDLAEPPVVVRDAFLSVSATSQLGIAALVGEVATRLVPESPVWEQAMPFTSRHAQRLEDTLNSLQGEDAAGAISSLDMLTAPDSSELA